MSLQPLTDYSKFKVECEIILKKFESENFTPIVFGIISQNTRIIMEAIKIVTIEINSSDILPRNNLFNFDLVMKYYEWSRDSIRIHR